MKKLKLNHAAAELIAHGGLRLTWRLYDDKDLSVNDTVELIDKVSADPETWTVIGTATITSIIEKRLGEALQSRHPNGDLQAVSLKQLQAYYGANVTTDTVVKIISFNFLPLKPQNTVKTGKNNRQIRSFKIYADGGSRGNPGPSASGFVIFDSDDNIIVDEGVYLGVTTNNQAEYRSLQLALQEVQKMGGNYVDIYMDSLLVINQMKGIFKVRNRDLWPIHDAIKQLLTSFDKVVFTHVPRELNKLADAAVNRTLDEALAR